MAETTGDHETYSPGTDYRRLDEREIAEREIDDEKKRSQSETKFPPPTNRLVSNISQEVESQSNFLKLKDALIGHQGELKQGKLPVEFINERAHDEMDCFAPTKTAESDSLMTTSVKEKKYEDPGVYKSIDDDNVEELEAQKDKNSPVKDLLKYAVEKSKDKVVHYLLKEIRHLKISELDKLLAVAVTTYIENIKREQKEGGDRRKFSIGEDYPESRTMRALLVALKARYQGEYFDELMGIFMATNQPDTIDKDKVLIPLFRIKAGIPLSVSALNDPPLLAVMKVFADSGDTTAMQKNVDTIRLLAKKELMEYGKISDVAIQDDAKKTRKKKKDIDTSIDLAIALDNSQSDSSCPAFTAILEGLSSAIEDRKKEEAAGDMAMLLLGEFAEDSADDRYVPIKKLVHEQLSEELRKYYISDEEQEKGIINIKNFLELARALHARDFQMATALTRKLPDQEDRKKWTRVVVKWGIITLVPASLIVLTLPTDTLGVDNAVIYAVMVILLHTLVKAHIYWNKNDSYANPFFAHSFDREKTIRGEINTLKPSRGLLKSLFFPAENKEGEGAISARSIARIDPNIQKHPLYALVTTFDNGSIPERTGWSKKFIGAVEEKNHEKACSQLSKALKRGEALGRKSDSNRYSTTDVLVEAFSTTVRQGDLTTFKALLNMLKEEEHGKFTFDLFSMVLNSQKDEAEKTPFMLALLRHKIGGTQADSKKPDSSGLLKSVTYIKPYHKSYYHLRMLSMMSMHAYRCCSPSFPQPQIEPNPWADVSEALMETAKLKTGPINPHGYVDPFSAVMSGLTMELPRDKKDNGLTAAHLDQLVKIMTQGLRAKIQGIEKEIGVKILDKKGEEKGSSVPTKHLTDDEQKKKRQGEVLDKNLTYLTERLTRRFHDVNDAVIAKSKKYMEDKQKAETGISHKSKLENFWIDADYRDVKNLMHYMGALCKGHSSRTPKEIWKESSETQIASPRLRQVLGVSPIIITLASVGVNSLGSFEAYGVPHLPNTTNVVLALIVAAAVCEGWLLWADKKGKFLPGAVKDTSELEFTKSEEQDLGFLTTAVKSSS